MPSYLETELASFLRASLERGDLWLPLLAGGLGGVLTSFTPCVYPLIPITVRYFGAMRDASRAKVVRLALTYIFGMTAFYALLGTAFAASNSVFGSFLGNSWVLFGIAFFCVLMGASMLGAFTLQLPTRLGTRLSQVGGQNYSGAIGMGLVSGLIAAPCTGPVLAVILTLIAKHGELLFGFWLMVAFAVGLGAPFLLLAIFSGSLSRLPKSGPWMEAVKAMLAALMFVVAVYFLQIGFPAVGRALQGVPQSMGIRIASVVLGIAFVWYALGGFSERSSSLIKVMGVVLVTAGLSLSILGRVNLHGTTAVTGGIAWLTSHDEGFAQARSLQRPMMIDFTADWCVACKELEHKTFSAPLVIEASDRFVALRLDATTMSDTMERIFERYGVLGLPTVVFVDSKGNTLAEPRVTGFEPPERFHQHMVRVK